MTTRPAGRELALLTSLGLLSVLAPSLAHAGGIGVLTTAGVHTESLYFYASADEEGNEFPTLDDYDQFRINQTLPNIGSGLEAILGDRDDRIVGVFRFYWLMDTPQQAPDVGGGVRYTPTGGGDPRTIDPEFLVVAPRDQARHLGIGSIGLSWGVLGKPDGFMLNAVGHVGSAFITLDHTEFLTLDIGPGVTWRAARQVQLFGDVAYQVRFRKEWSHSANVVLGARYLFD